MVAAEGFEPPTLCSKTDALPKAQSRVLTQTNEFGKYEKPASKSVSRLCLFANLVDVIQIRRMRTLPTHGEIRVQGLFEIERGLSGVRDNDNGNQPCI